MTENNKSPIIVLFYQDLRLKDNPALTFACETGHPIIPLYILDDVNPGKWKIGSSSRWWLHHSLESLNKNLQEKGSQLFLYRGDTLKILSNLIQKYQVTAIAWNRGYEPYRIALEQKIKKLLPTHSFNGSLLFEPWDIMNKQKEPFKVFTPFWNKCMEVESIEHPLHEPKQILTKKIDSEPLKSWELLSNDNNLSERLQKNWQVGEQAVHLKLNSFVKQPLTAYDKGRDVPSVPSTSLLSPHLHFGEISSRQVFQTIKNFPQNKRFLSQLGWREFSNYQLYHFPKLPEQPWRPEFSNFPWEDNLAFLKKWQQGETGYPIVDAGMRQLWETGWMHNRVRMITASFLVKDLFLPWQKGEDWFWEILVDADLANNSASWQWVAGCGFDAAPYFRIFNPVLQGKKFDPDGVYIKRWIPELAKVPLSSIHTPWKENAGLKLNYPDPIVDHSQARLKALRAFKIINTTRR